MADQVEQEERLPEIFLVSDGTGETAAAAARAAMSQFQTGWRYRFFGELRQETQVRRMMEQASEARAIVVFTLVSDALARAIRRFGTELGVPVVDLLGPVIGAISAHFDLTPQFRPGVLHGFTDDYFRRVEAVEFAVRHDDGTNLHTLFKADIVLTGISRTSKTPLSMYIAQRGYKTGNVPLVPGIEPPRELIDIDPRKVFGLTVDPTVLVNIRRARLRALPSMPYAYYSDPESVNTELRRAQRLFRARGWRSIDITGRAVEENASRILELYEQKPQVSFP